MARGDFGKAYAAYRKSGGLLGKKEFAKCDDYKFFLSRVRVKPVEVLPPDLPERT